MKDLLLLAGFASIVGGCGMMHVPTALVVAGVLMLAGAIGSHFWNLRGEANDSRPAV